MRSSFTAGLLLGAAATGLAAPIDTPYVCANSTTGQVPFKFPLSNGFPNVNLSSSVLTQIEKQAHGTLPNGALPKKMADTSATVWQVIAFNEIFEVAYFSSLLHNITNKVPGYDLTYVPNGEQIVKDLYTIRAQEEIHALGANAILATAGRTTVAPCEYKFPVDNFLDAINFASEFTDLVLGTLSEALYDFGLDGDLEFLSLLGAVIGQEGEQDGSFRALEGLVNGPEKVPSALPFLTVASAKFAVSTLMQAVVVPGSCPNAAAIGIPALPPLTVATPKVGPWTKAINFTLATPSDSSDLYLTYVNQINVPVVEQLANVTMMNGTTKFTALFPYEQYEMNGLTIAAITKGKGPFANATEVANAAVAGPALIEIN